MVMLSRFASACTGSAVLYMAVFGARPEPVADSTGAATARSLPHRTSPSAMVHSKTGKLSCEQAVRTSDIAHTSSTVSITTIGVEEWIRPFKRSSGLGGAPWIELWIEPGIELWSGLSNEFILI